MKTKDQKQRPFQQKESRKSNPLNAYIKYSGLAFQMCAVIGLAIWGGMALDDKFMDGRPVFVLISSFIGIAAAIYLLFRALPKS